MTPEEKIAALVEHIKKEFPEGCGKVKCEDCVLHPYHDVHNTTEFDICEMLSSIESRSSL